MKIEMWLRLVPCNLKGATFKWFQNLPKSPLCLLGLGWGSERKVERLLSCFITWAIRQFTLSIQQGNSNHLFELLLSLLQLQMALDGRIFAGKYHNFVAVEIVQQTRINLAGKLVMGQLIIHQNSNCECNLIEELFQKFNVDKHGGCISELFRDCAQKRFRTKNIVLRPCTTWFWLESSKPEFEHIDSFRVHHRRPSWRFKIRDGQRSKNWSNVPSTICAGGYL